MWFKEMVGFIHLEDKLMVPSGDFMFYLSWDDDKGLTCRMRGQQYMNLKVEAYNEEFLKWRKREAESILIKGE